MSKEIAFTSNVEWVGTVGPKDEVATTIAIERRTRVRGYDWSAWEPSFFLGRWPVVNDERATVTIRYADGYKIQYRAVR